ncbi:hypothetical protein SAMN06265338_12626 [Rhodoblastus acidophilus]|uniref:Uncharacterized protein n=1 Tax=Rhodoblastus acidophilus TaxID=1074 RepID=A0A212SD55_RHOAC|nr:hypothetical protein [Rhodoblastus acidophilus]PPQ35571.1 hypothetical protein CKO16_20220 [Rhodoblastus acidophilus]RAI17004.1 hypothetical protein CH337_18510 [Rhodoblastus acidophilus]SNB83420.1 hypothetical protein SAMN06265338_12626 [Rhodoblastus acidophilus]
MATEDFLPALSRAALERLGSGMGVLPRGKVKETRAAIIEQARETRVVLPQALFALSDEEATTFTRGYAYYGAGDDEDDGGEVSDADELHDEPQGAAASGSAEDAGEDEDHAAAA